MQRGDESPQVKRVQNLLNRAFEMIDKNLHIEVDGSFGAITEQAMIIFQTETGIHPSGKIDNATLKKLKSMGYYGPYGYNEFVDFYCDGKKPSKELISKYITICDLSDYKHELSRVCYNPGHPRDFNPLSSIERATGTFGFRCHEKCSERFQDLFKAWAKAKVLDRIKTFSGSWVYRKKKNKTGSLSTHAFGAAIDLNAQWNGYGLNWPPMKRSFEKGMVKLGEIAESLGICWGGYFDPTDAMHFQIGSGY